MTAPASPPRQGTPLGDGSPDDAPSSLPAEPAKTTAVSGPASGTGPAQPKPGTEEPELALEEDVPSDGRDPIGEAMIRDLPQSPELSEPPSQPNPSA